MISPEQKRAWQLWSEGVKQKEIAEIMDLKAVSTVNYHIHKFESYIEEAAANIQFYLKQQMKQFPNSKARIDFLHHFLISILPTSININKVDFPVDGLFIPRV